MIVKRFVPPIKGIFASKKSIFGKNSSEENEKTVFKSEVVAKIKEDLEERKKKRYPYEQRWILNNNFYVGNQYCDIRKSTGEIEQLRPFYKWMERETFNRIAPLIETRKANLAKIDLSLKVRPRTNELDDFDKAETSTTILKYIQNVSNFESLKNTLLSWEEITENVFLLSWWDNLKGNEIVREITVETDENGSETIKETPYFEGDYDYGVLTPYNVYPENLFISGIENQRSIILEQVMSVKEIKDVYGVEVDGEECEVFCVSNTSQMTFGKSMTCMSIGHETVENSKKVITYFEKRTPSNPNGKLIIIIGDELIWYGDLPYEKIPIVHIVSNEVAGQFFGKSVIEDLIPLQRAYNGIVNKIHEYIKRLAIQSVYVEEGNEDLIEELKEKGCRPGAIIPYPRGSNPPTVVQNGVLPTTVLTERQNLINDMEYVAGTSQLMTKGTLPSGVTSGTAIQNLINIDNTRLSLCAENIRTGIKEWGKITLMILKRHASTMRTVRYVGTNKISSALTWSNEDINSFDIEFDTENVLMLSEDMQKEAFKEAFNMGLFTNEQGVIEQQYKPLILKYMKLGNYRELISINELQMQNADRENVYFQNGILPEISDFDDDSIHIEQHTRFALQQRYNLIKRKKPEMAKAFEQHIQDHKQRIALNTQAQQIILGGTENEQ